MYRKCSSVHRRNDSALPNADFDAYQTTDDDDHSVAIANIEKGVHDACRLGLPIEFRNRPGLDHDPLMEKTIGEQLAWTRDRLEGKPWVGNCPR